MKKISIISILAVTIAMLIALVGCTVGPNNPNAMFNISANQSSFQVTSSGLSTAPQFTISLAGASSSNLYAMTTCSWTVTTSNGQNLDPTLNGSQVGGQTIGGGTLSITYNAPVPNLTTLYNEMTATGGPTLVNVNYTFTFTDQYQTKYTVKQTVQFTTSSSPSSGAMIQSASYSSGVLTITFSNNVAIQSGISTWSQLGNVLQLSNTSFPPPGSGNPVININATLYNAGGNTVTVTAPSGQQLFQSGFVSGTSMINVVQNNSSQAITSNGVAVTASSSGIPIQAY